MGMIPPAIIPPSRRRQEMQLKEEHPMQEKWARIDEVPAGGQSNRATLRLMKSIEESIADGSNGQKQKAQISIEMAQDAEEYIRNLIREEIEAHMEKIVQRIRYGGVPRSNPVIDRMETKGEPL